MMDMIHFCARLSAACSPEPLKAVRLLPDEIAVYLSPQGLLQMVHTLRQEFGAVFVDMFGLDVRSSRGVFQLHLIFALDDEHTAAFPSLVDELPATGWYEREVCEELGLIAQEHPLLRRLRLPPDWPEGIFPQQRPFSWTQKVQAVEPRYFSLEPAPVGVVDYPLGPVRSGAVESGHYTLRTEGEEIVEMRLQLFYKHRGVEKRAEGLALELLPLVAERISGTSAFAHSLALCHALESLAEVEVSPRARFLRTLLAELERLYNHLGYQADLCQATGLTVAQAQFDILKERVLFLFASIGGHRYLFGMNVPGGLSRDLTEWEQTALRELVVALRRDLETLSPLLLASASHRDRLEATGIL